MRTNRLLGSGCQSGGGEFDCIPWIPFIHLSPLSQCLPAGCIVCGLLDRIYWTGSTEGTQETYKSAVAIAGVLN